MSSSQKALRMFGILEIVFGILYFLFLFVIDKNQHYTYIISGAFALIFGICLLLASFNISLYKPAWYLGLINVILNAIGVIAGFVQKSDSHLIFSTVAALCFGIVILTLIFKVKKEGEYNAKNNNEEVK